MRRNGRKAAPVTLAERRIAPAADPALRARIEALAPWFHNMDLGGIRTAPDHFLGDYPAAKFARFADALPADLEGRSVLDIGCNAGFYALEMKRRRAGRVLAIDPDERYLAQARLAAEVLDVPDIEFRRLDVYDVGALGERFDLVIFMGVLYHLRHPLLALDLIHAHVADDLLLFQSMQRGSREVAPVAADYPFGETEHFFESSYPKLHFVEREYAHDWTNWWVPNRACSEAMLRAAGFAIETHAEEEVYLCRRTKRPYAERGAGPVYPARKDDA
ncbi:MAG: TIGR04290 family methyltransferase [Sphingomonadaceae bacterium]|nr:TIGR04290 family methyltransferase [Sphingomonadaceae bacterium]